MRASSAVGLHGGSKRGPSFDAPPVLDQHRPALVIAPVACYPHVPARESLAGEAGSAYERNRPPVPRLNVGLDAMQSQRSKCDAQREREPLGHVAAPGMRSERVVAEVRTAECATNDFAQVEDADERIILLPADEQADVGGRFNATRFWAGEAPQVRRETLPGLRRLNPFGVKGSAGSYCGDETGAVSRARAPQIDAVARGQNRRPRRWHNSDSSNSLVPR